jgi:hypothetical protein
MMRTQLLTVLLAGVLCSNSSQAQVPVVSKILPKVSVGLKAGANFQQMTGVYDDAYKLGFFGGAFLGVSKNKMGVQVEGLVKSVKVDLAASSSSYVRSTYLDIPVLFTYRLIPRVSLQVGPQYTMLLSAENDAKMDVKSYYKSSEVSGALGLEVRLPVHLTAGARYIMGFSDVNNTAATTAWRNRSIQVHVGFRLL